MKKVLAFFVQACLIVNVAGCAWLFRPKTNLPGYAGPKARIAVADFTVRADKADKEIGLGLRDMLITSLTKSNKFIIIEAQSPESARNEGSEKQESPVKAADVVIAATVAEFEPQASGGKAGMGGGGGVDSGLMGGLLGAALDKAHMSLDVQIVEASSLAVLSATRVQARAQEAPVNTQTPQDKRGLEPELSAYANTPMEQAMRECVNEAVKYISQSIPPQYYKY